MTSLVRVLLILGAALLALLTDAGASFLVEARLVLKRGSGGSVGRSAPARAGKSGSDPLPHPALALRAADRAGGLANEAPPARTLSGEWSCAAKATPLLAPFTQVFGAIPCDGLTFDIFEGD